MTLDQILEIQKLAIAVSSNTNSSTNETNAIFIFTGEDFFESHNLSKLLPAGNYHNLNSGNNRDWTLIDSSEQHIYMVIGKDNYDVEEIRNFALTFGGKSAFLPQEGFLDLILFGRNWWTDQTNLLNACLDHHEGLQYARSLAGTQAYGFQWPSTVLFTFNPPYNSMEEIPDYNDDSCLSRNGYQHSVNGRYLKEHELISALNKAIANEGLEACVMHMHHLLTRPISHNQPNACDKWTRHLAYMKDRYYDTGNNGFLWPQ